MASESGDLLQGTLGILILRALLAGPSHGYGLGRRVETETEDVLSAEEGSPYPPLRRREERGAVQTAWGASRSNRRGRPLSPGNGKCVWNGWPVAAPEVVPGDTLPGALFSFVAPQAVSSAPRAVVPPAMAA